MSSSVELAWRYLEIDQPERALEALGRTDETLLADPSYWQARGAALHALERLDEATESLQRGLELEPQDVGLLHHLAAVASARGDLAAAERAALAALAVAPEEPQLLVQYATIVARAGQFEKAERLLQRAAELEPEAPDLARARFFLASLRGERAKAGRHAAEMLADAPEDPNAVVASGLHRLASGDVGRGYALMRDAATLDPRVATELRDTFDEARLASHWALWPLRPLQRFSPALVWGVAVASIFALGRLGQGRLAGLLGLAWLVYCVYSWVAPWAVREWLGRGRS